jgi:hypothetical protein
VRRLDADYGETISIFQEEGRQMPGIPVARKESSGIGYGATKPAEAEGICPNWNLYLIATEERYGSSDAVNGRPVAEMLFEIESEALLSASANSQDDVFGSASFESLQQILVLDYGLIKRGKINIFIGDIDAALAKPAEVALRTGCRGHDPEGIS